MKFFTVIIFAFLSVSACRGGLTQSASNLESATGPAVQPQQPGVSEKKYTNKDGCVVTVENRRNGAVYFLSKGSASAVIGVPSDHKEGDIAGFCKKAKITQKSETLNLACDAESEAGSVTTRGKATIVLTKGLSSIDMLGERKGFFGWKVDTEINCRDLTKK